MSIDTSAPEVLARSYADYFDIVRADTPALLDEAYRVRYQVYCVENPFENANEHTDGRETDVDDDRSVHALLIHRPTGATAGTVRVILPSKSTRSRPLPIRRVIGPQFSALLGHLPVEAAGEVSRFSVSKDFRRRCGEEQYADIGFSGRVSTAIGERRLIPYISYGLIRAVIEICWEYNIDYVYAVVEPALIRLLARMAIFFEPIGEVVQYHGLRQPCVANVGAVVRQLRQERAMLWHCIGESAWPPRKRLPRSYAEPVRREIREPA